MDLLENPSYSSRVFIIMSIIYVDLGERTKREKN